MIIAYRYTAFYQASVDGVHIVRPMWMEYPTDVRTFNLESQFMFGDNILVAPKLLEQTPSQSFYEKTTTFRESDIEYNVSTYLPLSDEWYYWYSKQQREQGHAQPIIRVVKDTEQGMYVKAGTILPILMRKDVPRESLMTEVYERGGGIQLQIFLNYKGEASGLLYVDDFETFAYTEKNDRLLIEFRYYENKLTAKNLLMSSSPQQWINIEEAVIYGSEEVPKNFINHAQMLVSHRCTLSSHNPVYS